MLHSPTKQMVCFPALIPYFADTYSSIICTSTIVKQEFITWLSKLIFVKVHKRIEIK